VEANVQSIFISGSNTVSQNCPSSVNFRLGIRDSGLLVLELGFWDADLKVGD